MGAPNKPETVKMNFRLRKENVQYFRDKGIVINKWINEEMEKFVKKDKNRL